MLPAGIAALDTHSVRESDFWPEAADPECPLFRRYGRASRRDADIAFG